MKLIENINSILRFFAYLVPLMILIFGRDLIWRIFNKLKWYHPLVLKSLYIGLVILAGLFAAVAIYKLIRFGNYKRYKASKNSLTTESKIRIARLAEAKPEVEQFFLDNTSWLEQDIDNLIDMYAKDVSKQDFELFRTYVNDTSLVYFAHRVTDRKQFLDIINQL